VWIVEPIREVPLASAVSLEVRAGLHSSDGVELGVEARTVITFDTYPEFKFLGVKCTPKGESSAQNLLLEHAVDISSGLLSKRRCAPLKPIALLFSSPVRNPMLKTHISFTPTLVKELQTDEVDLLILIPA